MSKLIDGTWQSVPVKNFNVGNFHIAIFRETDAPKHFGYTISDAAGDSGEILDDYWDCSSAKDAEHHARQAVKDLARQR